MNSMFLGATVGSVGSVGSVGTHRGFRATWKKIEMRQGLERVVVPSKRFPSFRSVL
jgi:hypothetical protein